MSARQLRRSDLADRATYRWAERELGRLLPTREAVDAILVSCRDRVLTAPCIYYYPEPIASTGITVIEYVPRVISDPPIIVGVICFEESGIWLEGYEPRMERWVRVEAARAQWTSPGRNVWSHSAGLAIPAAIEDQLDEAIAARAYQALTGEGEVA
jgi:hypothetical protein